MSASTENRRGQLQAEIVRLDALEAGLARNRRQIRWLALVVPLSIPAFAVGVGFGALVVGSAIVLVSCAAYVVWAHGNEYRGKRTTVRQLMAQAETDAAG